MVKLLITLTLLIVACSPQKGELPPGYYQLMTLPKSLDLHDNSCAVLTTVQTDRLLGITREDICQVEWDQAGVDICFSPLMGTRLDTFLDRYKKLGYETYVNEADSCLDYELIRQMNGMGCVSQIAMFSVRPGDIGGHIEAILDILVLKNIAYLPEAQHSATMCTLLTNSWGAYGIISGFSLSQYHHNKFPYPADYTRVYLTTICPADFPAELFPEAKSLEDLQIRL